jgi:glycosyltransferase involved in cell wall biosynthesis
MRTFPRISIITPSFNQCAFIEQTIRSVLEQDYPNIEYIIIDGGSTDETLDIIRRYESGIAYWVSDKDRGQAHAINKGLGRATGDIIAYLNSDDYYIDGALARVAEAFNRHPNRDLLHGRCRIVDEHGNKLGERVGSIRRFDEILDLWDVWWNRRNFVQPEVFWTKRIAKKVGAFREDLFWVLDYEYWLRILAAGGRIGSIDAELAAFRLHSNQKSAQRDKAAEELLQVVHPYIFDESCALGMLKRIELRGKWDFHAGFLKEVEQSLQRREKRWRRMIRLALFFTQHPHIAMARNFRGRLFDLLSFAKAG